MSQELNETIISWMNEYGERRISKKYGSEYIAIPVKERKELFRHLVKTLIDKGYTKESFRFTTVETIVKACFPPEEIPHDSKARKQGLAAARRQLEFVIDEFFSQKLSVAEQPEKLQEYDPAKHGRLGKELDRSAFKDAPKPNTEIDVEASKLLGFDDE